MKHKYFNSIKVRLELRNGNRSKNHQLYFNSIKVRLELADAPKTIAEPVKFQFHKGTIRTE